MEIRTTERREKPGRFEDLNYLPYHPLKWSDIETSKSITVFSASPKRPEPSLKDCLWLFIQRTKLKTIAVRKFTNISSITYSSYSIIFINKKERSYLRFFYFKDMLSDKSVVLRNRFASVVFEVNKFTHFF